MSTRSRLLFGALAALWGIPYLFIKLAVDGGLTPASLAFARIAVGGAILLALAARAGTLDSLRGHLRWIAIFAIVEFAVPLPLIGLGEEHVASSIAAIIIASVPLIIAALAVRFDHAERVSGRRLFGLLLGLTGVVALVGIDTAGRSSTLLGAGAILVAALGYAAGPMILKGKLAAVDPRALMGAALAAAAVVLAPVAALDAPARAPSATAWASLAVLAVLCTAAAFALMAILIVDVGPSRASVVTYINPVVAVALGIAVLGEHPGLAAFVGLIAILAGSWLATSGWVAREARPAAAPPGR